MTRYFTLCAEGFQEGKKSEERIVLDIFLASSSVKGETDIAIERVQRRLQYTMKRLP